MFRIEGWFDTIKSFQKAVMAPIIYLVIASYLNFIMVENREIRAKYGQADCDLKTLSPLVLKR